MIIRSRAPLRLGLAGGGTDVSPYPETYGGCVLNGTIDRYAYTTVTISNDNNTYFEALDLQQSKKISLANEIIKDGILDLHTELYTVIMNEFNDGKFIPIRLSTFCDAEAGSGLGSSSTVVVSMIQEYVKLLNLPLDYYSIANLAYKVERINCGFQGGKQDQFSATFGGFNFMEFYENEKTIVNPLRLHKRVITELEASLILCYTGISRDSSKIIKDQSNNLKDESSKPLQAMHAIKDEALAMKEHLLTGNIEGFVNSMKKGWKSKKESSKSITNETINNVYETAIDAGALSGKISGAGGGGYLMLFAPPENRMQVIRSIKSFDMKVSNCHFVSRGCYSWKV